MRFIVKTLALMVPIYLIAGWLHIGGALREWLSMVVAFLLSAGYTVIKLTKRPAFKLGRYTAGITANNCKEIFPSSVAIQCRLIIDYVDAKNCVTTRTIDVTSYTTAATPDGEIVPFRLQAFCHMRQEMRTFCADRIIRCQSEPGQEITDLMAFLLAAPTIITYDGKNTVCQRTSCGQIDIEYQFRTGGAYKRITITPSAVGYLQDIGDSYCPKTAVFVEGLAEGVQKPKRYRLRKIQNAWSTADQTPILSLSGHLLGHAGSAAQTPDELPHPRSTSPVHTLPPGQVTYLYGANSGKTSAAETRTVSIPPSTGTDTGVEPNSPA